MTTLNTIKIAAFSALSAAMFATPSFAQNAAGTTQVTKQEFGQVGIGNNAVVGSQQLSVTDQATPWLGSGINAGQTVQVSGQKGAQIGVGNNMGLSTIQDSTAIQGDYFSGAGLNGGKHTQLSDQAAGQSGIGNTLNVTADQKNSLYQF